jgi:hypothetical protein
MPGLPFLSQNAARSRLGLSRLAVLALLVSGCHLVVTPTGGDGDGEGTASDQSDVEARACGDRTCSEGTECCNASCGICTAPGNVCIQIACEPGDHDTTCKTTLCGPGDICMDTPAGAVCVPAQENPCNLVDCQPNSTCKVENGAPVCVPLNGGSGDAGTPSKKDAGSATPSDAGTSATDAGSAPSDAGPSTLDGGPTGADAGNSEDAGTAHDAGHGKDSGVVTPVTCATVLCPTGTYCDDIGGSPQCLPLPSCATVKCSAGYHCELQQVVCVRAPCPPQPQCVPDRDPTDPCGGKCKANERCQVLEIQCITTPCDPIAQCVPKTTCGCSGKGACLDIVCPAVEQY